MFVMPSAPSLSNASVTVTAGGALPGPCCTDTPIAPRVIAFVWTSGSIQTKENPVSNSVGAVMLGTTILMDGLVLHEVKA